MIHAWAHDRQAEKLALKEAPADGYYRLKLDRLKWMSGDPEKPLSSLLFRGFQRKLNNTKASV
jgi:hypothetical protein